MKKIINFYKNLTFFQGVTCAVVFTSVIGIAATVGPMTTFTPNTVISSSEVNANFAALKQAIETNNSQVYKGTWNAVTNIPDLSTLGMFSAGEYYVVSTAGIYMSITYMPGDWIIFNGTNWEKLSIAPAVTSVFGRSGNVVAMKGDYNLNKLTDVDLTAIPNDNDVLKYDAVSQKWKAGFISLTESDPTVQGFAKNTLPMCSVGQVLKSDGSTFSCVNDSVGAAPFAGANNMVMVTDATGSLASSTTASAKLAYLNDVAGAIGASLNSKAFLTNGTQVITALSVSGLADPISFSEAANKSYVDGIISSKQLTGLNTSTPSTISSTDNTVSALGKVQAQINSMSSSINNNGQWSKNGSDISFNTGNVGIGVPTPVVKLDIGTTSEPINFVKVNSQNMGKAGFIANSDGNATIHMLANFSGSPFQGMPNQTTGFVVGNAYPLVFAVNTAEHMRITPAGNVGIGTTLPNDKLEVTGNIKASNYVKGSAIAISNFSTASATSFSKDGAFGTGLFFPITNELAFSTANTERLRITAAGAVGIGKPNPGYALDVVGDINASLTVKANAVTLASDRRLKSNITTIKSALQKVLSLRGVEFNWIKTGTKDLGVIAQEVEKIFPTLVLTDKEGMKSVKYPNMAGVLIESTKELNAKVVTLEAENKMLKSYLCDKDPSASFCK